MSTLDDEIAEIKSKLANAQLKKVRAEALRESAQSAVDSYTIKLSQEFGVDNLDQARAKLVQLQGELRSKMDDVANLLDEMKL